MVIIFWKKYLDIWLWSELCICYQLRGKENILAYYESIKIDPKNVKVARLDQAAYPPEKKIKPKRKLIIILGLILGLILGIFVAFIRNIQGNKEVQDN